MYDSFIQFQLSSENEVRLSTMMVARITKLPYLGTPKDKPIKSEEVFVTAIPDPVPKPDVIPLWIVVLSACAGALILLLLIYLLYKVSSHYVLLRLLYNA